MRFREDEEKYLDLIEKSRLGSSEDFQQLYRRYWPLVRRLWQRYNIAGLELADWEQEAQVVMLEVIRLYNNQGPRMFSCFLKECLTNRIRDLQRQSQAGKRIPTERLYALTDEYAEVIIDFWHHSPDEIIYCRQSIKNLLHNCSQFERKVLNYLHNGYSIEEIAISLKCPKRSIQSALHRCHLKLIQVLSKEK
ncbi:sigma-70 family RNA polymerase sigma factor [Lactobacillus sp. 0.1XD8-4]|uniref:RNA polymerase sigma factor n=1 Tax=uncultured Limosilactobacillus sp. TaxID=2837629 RepID=UPI00129EF9E8|nr:sigma-70 family RNA polymerase sigma factor [uncultured Limosilactobacillus sp.]MRN06421.1 sigma-70 family RNA polymerase sigma factor [Lactobacillus sp. 0.1XD8-4]